MNENLPIPNSGLTEPEAEAQFAELQKKLVPLLFSELSQELHLRILPPKTAMF